MSEVGNVGAAPVASEGAQGEGQVEGQNGTGLPGEAGASGTPGGVIGEAAKEAMRKYRVKVEGQEIEVDEEELKRGYGHRKVAARELSEGKRMKAQAEKFAEMLNNDDTIEEVFKKLGKDPRKLAEKILSRHLEDELMDPREKELRDTKRKLQEYEDLKKRHEEAQTQKRHAELKTKYEKEYSQQFEEVLKAEKVPATKYTIGRMAHYIGEYAKFGMKIGPEDAAKLVNDDLKQITRHLTSQADGETLLNLLGGDEVANKIRKYDTSRVKDPSAFLRVPEQAGEHRERGEPKKRMSAREWQLMKRGLK